MTIPRATIPRAALKELVEGTSGLATIWDSEDMPFVGGNEEGPNAYVELSLVSYVSVFVDDYRQLWNEGNNALDTQLYGYRLLTLGVKIRSFDWDNHPADLCERVRWRMRTVSARAIYAAAGLSLVTIGAVSLYNEKADDQGSPTRLIFCGAFDVKFGLVVVDHPQDDAGLVIDTVNTAQGGAVPIALTRVGG